MRTSLIRKITLTLCTIAILISPTYSQQAKTKRTTQQQINIRFESFPFPKDLKMKRGFRIIVDTDLYKHCYRNEPKPLLTAKDLKKFHIVLISRGMVPKSQVGLKIQSVKIRKGPLQKELVIQCYEPSHKPASSANEELVHDQLAVKIHAFQKVNDEFILINQKGQYMF